MQSVLLENSDRKDVDMDTVVKKYLIRRRDIGGEYETPKKNLFIVDDV